MKRFQFSSRHLLYVMTIVAVLIFPTQAFVKWFGRFRKTAASTVTVPDGGTLVFGNMAIRSDGTHVALQPSILALDSPSHGIQPKMVIVTPGFIIPEEEEDLVIFRQSVSHLEIFPDIKR
jgi:hypothetical protein